MLHLKNQNILRKTGVFEKNILFFLTPKSEIAYINDDDTLRQALEKMEHHKYLSLIHI